MKELKRTFLRRKPIRRENMHRALSFLGIALLGTVIAGGQVLYQMAPFGVAFFSVVFRGGATYALIPLFSLAVLFRGMPLSSAMGYGVAMLFFSLIRLYVDEKRISPVMWAAVAGSLNAVAGALVMIGSKVVWYDAFELFLESTLCFLSAWAFQVARIPFLEIRTRRWLEVGEAMALSASAGIVLLGMSDIFHIGGFHPERALGALLVMLFAYKYGMAAAGVGVAAGFFLGMNDYMLPETVASFGLCALLSGILCRYKKWGVAVGFILSNAFFTLLINGSMEVIIHLSESVAAALVFALIPERILAKYGGFSAAEREEVHELRIRESAAREVEGLAAAFRRLANAIGAIGNRPGARPVEEMLLFHRTVQGVCADCGMRHACWKTDREKSGKALGEMLCLIKEWGSVEEERLPEKLRADCVRQKEMCRVFSHMYEFYKIDRLHAERTAESRRLTTAQIEQMTRAAERIAQDIKAPAEEDGLLSARLRRALYAAEIRADEVKVLHRKDGRLFAELTLSPCGGFGRCKVSVLPIVEQALGVSMEKVDDSVCGECRVTFGEPYAFSPYAETVKRRAEGSPKSGDRYSFLHLPNGVYAALLCDGTGTGYKAARESREAVRLMEALLSAGVEAKTAMRLLNAALLSAGGQEIYTVCDLFLLDCTNGMATFLKSGAPDAYRLRKGTVEVIKCGGLPAGSSGGGQVAQTNMKLLPGDRIVLCSDGVGDGMKSYEIAGFLEDHADDPTELLAERLTGLGTGRDDRTVVLIDIRTSREKHTSRKKGKKRETV